MPESRGQEEAELGIPGAKSGAKIMLFGIKCKKSGRNLHFSESLGNFAPKNKPFRMIKITRNASLLPYNTFGMDVRTAMLIEYETETELDEVLNMADVRQLMHDEQRQGKLPFWHIGSGSNLLFTADYPGVVLHCTARGIAMRDASESEEECLIDVKAGTLWDDVCAYCAEQELYGPENLSLIPGETGAAAVQNIGAYGVEIKDLVLQVKCWSISDRTPQCFTVDRMHYGYRDSIMKHEEWKRNYIVTEVTLKVSRKPRLRLDYAGLRAALGDTPTVTAQLVRDTVISIREGKLPDPRKVGNAGSFFKNPVVDNQKFEQLLAEYPTMPHYKVDDSHTKIPAGWMIEQCGWKGRSLGRAGVYERQSLVLVNRGGAAPDEIVRLSDAVIDDVEHKFGIRIEPEVNFIR